MCPSSRRLESCRNQESQKRCFPRTLVVRLLLGAGALGLASCPEGSRTAGEGAAVCLVLSRAPTWETAWGAPWRLSGWSCNQEVTCSPLDQVILASSVRTAGRTRAASSTQCAGGACCPCRVLAGGDPGQTAALKEEALLGKRTLRRYPTHTPVLVSGPSLLCSVFASLSWTRKNPF